MTEQLELQLSVILRIRFLKLTDQFRKILRNGPFPNGNVSVS